MPTVSTSQLPMLTCNNITVTALHPVLTWQVAAKRTVCDQVTVIPSAVSNKEFIFAGCYHTYMPSNLCHMQYPFRYPVFL